MKLLENISYKMKIDNVNKMVDYIKEYLYNNDELIISNRFYIYKDHNSIGLTQFYLLDKALTRRIVFSHIVEYMEYKLEYFNIKDYDYYDTVMKELELWYNNIVIEMNYYE